MSPTQQPDPKPDRRDPGAPGRPGDRPHPDQELPGRERPERPEPTPTPPPTTPTPTPTN